MSSFDPGDESFLLSVQSDSDDPDGIQGALIDSLSNVESHGAYSATTSSRLGRTVKKRKKSSWVYNHFLVDSTNGQRRCNVRRCKAV